MQRVRVEFSWSMEELLQAQHKSGPHPYYGASQLRCYIEKVCLYYGLELIPNAGCWGSSRLRP